MLFPEISYLMLTMNDSLIRCFSWPKPIEIQVLTNNSNNNAIETVTDGLE